MQFIVLNFIGFFDFFHKRKILKVLKLLLEEKNNIIFDVGAHQGETVEFLYKNFIISHIFSFEPLEKNFKKLKKNTERLKSLVNYFNFALGEKKEKKLIKEMIETSSSTLNDINEDSNYFKRKKFFLGLSKEKKMYREKTVSIEKGKSIINKFNIKTVNLLKIDTEGYELNVIKGFERDIKKIRVILFEHHYDLMIKKKYKFNDINIYLKDNGFELRSKFKMPFRKTFEYIYINRKIN